MQLILSSERYQTARPFFAMRFLRIYLPYFICLAFCLFAGAASWWYCGNGLSAHRLIADLLGARLRSGADYWVMLSNVTVLFQDVVMLLDRDVDGNLCLAGRGSIHAAAFYPYLIIPQAWSIAVELQFYLLSPWLARRFTTLQLLGLILCCLLIRLACIAAYSLDFDPWTYRFAPFELSKFLVGMLGCRLLWQDRRGRAFCDYLCSWTGKMPRRLAYPVSVIVVLLLMRVHLGSYGLVNRLVALGGPLLKELPGTVAVLLSAVVVPVCFRLTQSSPIDRKVGELSFPVYLLHLTVVLALTGPLSFLLPAPIVLGEFAIITTLGVALLLQFAVLDRLEFRRQQRIVRAHTC